MKYTLLNNGVDSLKGAYLSLEKLSELAEGKEHNVKDAVLNINHAVEILFKLLLKNQNEYLVFSDLDKYMKAKEKMLDNHKNVLTVNPNLKTVTLHEAIRRAEFLCNIEVTENFKTVINFINDKRNQITHYEIELNEQELEELIENLKACYELTVDFFEEKLGSIEELLDEARFEITVDDYLVAMAEEYGDMQIEENKLAALEDWYERDL